MPSAKQNFFSIVLVGRPNPQILNHDFLVQNGILPEQEPFFRQLKEGEDPFTQFFSAPPLAQITYDEYSLSIQEDRYQAMDTTRGDPAASPIIEITQRYFGEVLKYTPFKLGGFNLNCDLVLGDEAEIGKFDAALGIDRDRAATAFEAETPTLSTSTSFPFEDGCLMVAISKPKDVTKPVKLNFNFEFEYASDMGAFLSRLNDVGKIADYRTRFYDRMGISA